MGHERKKYKTGTAAQFITRKKACQRLQLSLADFRRLCILKGVYPHEPNNRKKAGRGSTAYKTFYFKKDIQFLLHEPIITKFRQNKIYLRKLARAKGREEKDKYEHLRKNIPRYKVDHIVRERYPNFIDAVRDMDDALCMCFLFSTLPKAKSIRPQTTQLCRRLCVEFMHYLIASRSLRKVFISIKGYYFQAEIMSQTVTWLVPHNFAHTNFVDVDFRVMMTFAEFYTTMLGFVMYRLFHSLNLHYPPKIALLSALNNELESGNSKLNPKFCTMSSKMFEVVASLNVSLVRNEVVVEEEERGEDEKILDGEMTEAAMEAKKKRDEEETFKKLFEGLKFFISREIPKEQFVFVIKCFGGEVSWDRSSGMGSTYTIDDETITHHVVDRPVVDKTYISRYYIQPQWIFDCVNARMLLPLTGYLPGDVLPPHLSPFVSEEDGMYIPPERHRVIALQRGEDPGINNEDENLSENEDERPKEGKKEAEDEVERTVERKPKRPKSVVKPGKTDVDRQLHPDNFISAPARCATYRTSNPFPSGRCAECGQLKSRVAAEEKKLAIMMIPKRRRRLYNKITYGLKRKKREAEQLALKRKLIDDEMKKEKQAVKKGKRKQTVAA